MNLLYYEDKNLKECDAKVLQIWTENEKNYLRLDNNIFYAQGGGQKGDKGKIIYNDCEFQVINCIKDESGYPVIITDQQLPTDCLEKQVKCILNWDFRYLQMKLHTSLHLLHYLIVDYYKKEIDYPVSSNIEVDFAYNKYPQEIINEEVINYVQNKFDELLKQDIEVITYPDQNNNLYRYWKCMNYVIPCGGIHVSKLSEIKKVNVEYHTKKGITTIKLTLV